MNTRRLTITIIFAAILFGLVACGNDGGQGRNRPGQGGGSGTSANTAGNPVVHMDNTVFIPPAMTIKTGESLTLTADTFVPHFISNGTWDDTTARPAREPNAPEVTELHINGNESAAIGPFTTAGTYQFYCTIHPKMNLAVTVE